MLQEKSFVTNGIRLNYAEGPGGNPPLVLLHGGSGRWQEFLALLPGLVLRWHVYALDMRGHGKSDVPPPGKYRVVDMAEDVNAFVQQLGQPSVLFGHSMGGYISLCVAAANPRLIKAVIIGDSPLQRDYVVSMLKNTSAMWQEFAELTRAATSTTELARQLHALVQPTIPGFDMTAARNTAKNWRMAANILDPFQPDFLDGYEPEALLSQIKCPTLLLQGDAAKNGLMTDADVAMALEKLANSTHVKLEGVGHGLHWEQPQRVLQMLFNFLESLDD